MDSGDRETRARDLLSLVLLLEPDPELDSEAGERLTRQLRAELSELDIESIALAAGGAAPAGAKSADPITLGALVVALSASGGVFTALVETVRDWLGRHAGRHRISVTIDGDTIELERATLGSDENSLRPLSAVILAMNNRGTTTGATDRHLPIPG